MAYCPKCGVQLDPGVRVCPLDNTPIPAIDNDPSPLAEPWPESDPYAKVHATSAEIRDQAFAIIAGILVLTIVVVFSVDFFLNGGFNGGMLSWSIPSSVALVAALGYVVAGFRLYHAFLPLTLSYMVITALLMAGLDALDTIAPWFLVLGLPILVDLLITLIVSYAYILRAKTKGYNVFGMIFGAAAVFLIVLDMLILLYLKGTIFVSWSVLTSLALIPLSLFFFYLHYVVKRKVDLGRTFHF